MYFNLKSNVNLNKNFERRRTKKRRLSTTKIFVSKSEIKHYNDKVVINLYTYNRNKKYFLKKLRKLYKKLFNFTYISNFSEQNSLSNYLKQNSSDVKSDLKTFQVLFSFEDLKNIVSLFNFMKKKNEVF